MKPITINFNILSIDNKFINNIELSSIPVASPAPDNPFFPESGINHSIIIDCCDT